MEVGGPFGVQIHTDASEWQGCHIDYYHQLLYIVIGLGFMYIWPLEKVDLKRITVVSAS